MAEFDFRIIETIIFLLLLYRTRITDLSSGIIENKIIICLLVNKIVWGVIVFIQKRQNPEEIVSAFVMNLFLWVLFIAVYSTHLLNIGAGDIKLLCAAELYFSENEIIQWLIILSALLTVAFLAEERLKTFPKRHIPLAPFVFWSTLLYYAFKSVLYVIYRVIAMQGTALSGHL